jgi:hypothetical protein
MLQPHALVSFIVLTLNSLLYLRSYACFVALRCGYPSNRKSKADDDAAHCSRKSLSACLMVQMAMDINAVEEFFIHFTSPQSPYVSAR